MAVSPAVPDDFMLSANKTLTIAAGRTDSDGTVTVRAMDNNVDATTKEVRVSAAADNSQGIAGNPPAVTLRIADDDDAPELTLEVGPSAIVEDGGVSTVTVESVNGVAFAQDQRIALALAGTAVEGHGLHDRVGNGSRSRRGKVPSTPPSRRWTTPSTMTPRRSWSRPVTEAASSAPGGPSRSSMTTPHR